MRWLVSSLGMVGAAGAGHLGLRWLEDAARHQAVLGSFGHDHVLLSVTAYALMGAMVAGVLGSMLAWQRRGRTAGTILLTAGLVPGILDLRAFVVTCILILAGLLAYELHGTARLVTRRLPTHG